MARKEEDFSDFVSHTLHTIGYKWDLIQRRREFSKLNERQHNVDNSSILDFTSMINAGSKREGVSACTSLTGDIDQMNVFDQTIATENERLFENERSLFVFKLDLKECPSGYSFLVVKTHGRRSLPRQFSLDYVKKFFLDKVLGRSCLSYSGTSCLSSEIFINTMSTLLNTEKGLHTIFGPDDSLHNLVKFQSRAGPSIPESCKISSMQNICPVDNVFAIRCHCPSIFERFQRRPRYHDWPPEDVLQELSQLEAHVVPVGCKRSANTIFEWRICFTKAEIRLIECLTEPQIQVFILLKIFAKDVLKDVWDAMTSYVMKNVILWVAELTPGHKFRTYTIVDRFLACLFFLKMCIKAGRLPNYMIAERNLLSHDQFIVKKRKLLSTLDDCLREKGSCLFRSSRLKEAMTKMYRSPDLAIRDGLAKDTFEHTSLNCWIRMGQFTGHSDSMQEIMLRCALSGGLADIRRLVKEKIHKEDIRHGQAYALQKTIGRCFHN